MFHEHTYTRMYFCYTYDMDFTFQRQKVGVTSKDKILAELEKVAKRFNYVEFSYRDFNKYANMSASTVKKHFGSWRKGLDALQNYLTSKGLHLNPRPFAPNRIYTDKELFDEMERIWQIVGQRPSRYEWEQSSPKISYQTYKQRFGGWTNACLKFIEYKMGNSILADEVVTQKLETDSGNQISDKHQVKEDTRDVPLGLRLKVLSRDNFRCVFCGRSPATDIGVKLHIDHIQPFSKGGKTTVDNLQTLCLECNLGKSNLEI